MKQGTFVTGLDICCKENRHWHCIAPKENSGDESVEVVDISWDCIIYLQGSLWCACDKSLEEKLRQIDNIRNVCNGWNIVGITTVDKKGLILYKEKLTLKRIVMADGTVALLDNIQIGESHVIGVNDEGIAGRIDIVSDPPAFLKFNGNLRIQEVVCGKDHVILLSKIGVVYSFGLGSRGQLGNDCVEDRNEPEPVEALEALRVVSIAAGGWHSAAVSDLGDLYVWGWNDTGQLGLPCQNIRKDDKDCVNVQCSPQLVDIVDAHYDSVAISKVSCGSRHTAVLAENGDIFTCGWNEYGQLGHDDTIPRDKMTRVDVFDKHELRGAHLKCGGWTSAVTLQRI